MTFQATSYPLAVCFGADRHDRGTKLTRHIVLAPEFQRGTGASAVIKIKMIANLGQAGRAIRLDHRRGGQHRCARRH